MMKVKSQLCVREYVCACVVGMEVHAVQHAAPSKTQALNNALDKRPH